MSKNKSGASAKDLTPSEAAAVREWGFLKNFIQPTNSTEQLGMVRQIHFHFLGDNEQGV